MRPGHGKPTALRRSRSVPHVVIGCTPARFVEQARVIAAMQLLRRTRWTQERIASRSGFRSVDALQRAFAKHEGVTPRAWRVGERAGRVSEEK